MTIDPAAGLAKLASSREHEFGALSQRRVLSDALAATLLAELTSGAFAPGDRLPPERELGVRYGVSRTVVREAIRSLVSRGVVAVRPGAGVFVARADSSVAIESLRILLRRSPQMSYETVYELRQTIEERVVELAAERALESEFDRLRDALTRTYTAPTPEAYAIADSEFHRSLASLAHNELFEIVLEVVGDIMMDIRRQVAYLPAASKRVAADHQRIADAVIRRDVAGARQAMKAHLGHSRDIVLQLDESRRRSSQQRVAPGPNTIAPSLPISDEAPSSLETADRLGSPGDRDPAKPRRRGRRP
jgi:GntR family transcriptional repressor for pyruvate dehydrogenase complex